MRDGHDWRYRIKLLLVASFGIVTALCVASAQPLTMLNLANSALVGVCAAFALACLIATQDMDR